MLLAYVNLLWFTFTIVGLVAFGIFPSTASLYTVVRKWMVQGTDTPVWKTFWGTYRKEFLKANLVGYLFLLIGWLLFIDLKFFQHQGNVFGLVISYVFVIAFIIYMVMALFLFPVFVHYDLKILKYLKQTFFIVMLRPLEVIFAVIGSIGVYYLMIYVPGLIPFFSMSLLAYVTMWSAYRAFEKISLKFNDRQGDD